MKRKNKWNRVAAFLAALMLMALSLCQAVFAEESAGIDPEKLVQLDIDLEAVDRVVTVSLYQVGIWDGSTGGDSGSSGGGGTTGGPGVTTAADPLVIPEEQVPLANIPLLDILPKTGDTTNLMFWAALMTGSAFALAVLLAVGKRMDK